MIGTQILFADEVEALAGRVTDAVFAVLDELAAESGDLASSTLVSAARDRLHHEPVEPAPMVRAILRRAPTGRPLAAEEEDEFGVALTPRKPVISTALVVIVPAPVVAMSTPVVAVSTPAGHPLPSTARVAPAYWPAIPAISDELFAEQQKDESDTDESFPHDEGLSERPGAVRAPAELLEFLATKDPQPVGELPALEPEDPGHVGVFHHRSFGRRRKAHQ